MNVEQAQVEIRNAVDELRVIKRRLKVVVRKLHRAAETAPVVDQLDGDKYTAEGWLADCLRGSVDDHGLDEVIRCLRFDLKTSPAKAVRQWCDEVREQKRRHAADGVQPRRHHARLLYAKNTAAEMLTNQADVERQVAFAVASGADFDEILVKIVGDRAVSVGGWRLDDCPAVSAGGAA